MTVIGKHKTQVRPDDSVAEPQQPHIGFEDAIQPRPDTRLVANPIDKASFNIHKGALADAPNSQTINTQLVVAQPFVKWAGGKRNLLNSIRPLLPERIENYYENFVGGGALFFAIADRIKHAYLSDSNLDLVITYQVIKADPTHLVARLRDLAAEHSPGQFYRVRDEEPTAPVEVAARFIYLNKTCFNGLFRVNKSGKFNVPIGNYKNPNIVNEGNLLACNKALQKATITFHPYNEIDPKPTHGDFCYLDPPYHPTADDSFTAYTKENFTEQDQSALRDYAVGLHRRGVKVMLSNSKTKFIASLYGDDGMDKIFRLHTVQAPRMVNCKPGQRGAVDEYLITNY